jgi:hypothetical protein
MLVPNGTLKKLINEEEEKAGLAVNTVALKTVRSRIKGGNLTAYNKNQQSPITDIEPIIAEFCIHVGKMGSSVTKTTVIELANYIICRLEIEEEVFNCKKLRNLKSNKKLGTAWYRGFYATMKIV